MTKVLLAVLVIGLLGIAVVCSTFSSSSICAVCGARSSAIDYQFPLTNLTYWTQRFVGPTPLSNAADDLNLASAHAHQWKLIHGAGNGIMCAVGDGGVLNRNATSEIVVAFVKDTAAYRGDGEARKWLATALDRKSAQEFDIWLRFSSYPEKRFSSPESYEEWRSNCDAEWRTLDLNRERR